MSADCNNRNYDLLTEISYSGFACLLLVKFGRKLRPNENFPRDQHQAYSCDQFLHITAYFDVANSPQRNRLEAEASFRFHLLSIRRVRSCFFRKMSLAEQFFSLDIFSVEQFFSQPFLPVMMLDDGFVMIQIGQRIRGLEVARWVSPAHVSRSFRSINHGVLCMYAVVHMRLPQSRVKVRCPCLMELRI